MDAANRQDPVRQCRSGHPPSVGTWRAIEPPLVLRRSSARERWQEECAWDREHHPGGKLDVDACERPAEHHPVSSTRPRDVEGAADYGIRAPPLVYDVSRASVERDHCGQGYEVGKRTRHRPVMQKSMIARTVQTR